MTYTCGECGASGLSYETTMRCLDRDAWASVGVPWIRLLRSSADFPTVMATIFDGMFHVTVARGEPIARIFVASRGLVHLWRLHREYAWVHDERYPASRLGPAYVFVAPSLDDRVVVHVGVV